MRECARGWHLCQGADILPVGSRSFPGSMGSLPMRQSPRERRHPPRKQSQPPENAGSLPVRQGFAKHPNCDQDGTLPSTPPRSSGLAPMWRRHPLRRRPAPDPTAGIALRLRPPWQPQSPPLARTRACTVVDNEGCLPSRVSVVKKGVSLHGWPWRSLKLSRQPFSWLSRARAHVQ